MNFLETILAHKRAEVEELKLKQPLKELLRRPEQFETRDFAGALRRSSREPALIAEVKLASPSKGVLCDAGRAATLPKTYASAGAACLSVVTEKKFFNGSDELLSQARRDSGLPVLRKDFILDEYQLVESRALGADCILLIAACLNASELTTLSEKAKELGLARLVEVHNRGELERALELRTELIGINNRGLRSFETSLSTTLELMQHVPKGHMVVAESGIFSRNDIKTLKQSGVAAVLIGEALITSADPAAAIRDLYGED